MRSKYIVVLVCFFVLTTGCSSTIQTKGWNTPAKDNKTDFFVVTNDSITTNNEASEVKNYEAYNHMKSIFQEIEIVDKNQVENILVSGSNEFRQINLNEEYCPRTQTDRSTMQASVSPILVPLLSTLGKYIFDQIQDSRARQIKALKKASTVTYTGRAFVNAGDLKNARCVVMVRHGKEKKGSKEKRVNNLIVVAKLNHMPAGDPAAFTLTPTYVKANNSVVITKEKVKNEGSINLAIALAVKSIGLDRNTGLENLSPVGAAALSIGKVTLNGEPTNLCEKPEDCLQSELIPHIGDDTYMTSVTMSVTEVGITGIDFDQREAEIKALKDAFGPAIQEALKAELPKN